MAKKPPARKSVAKSRDKLKIGKRTLKDLGARGENVKGGAAASAHCTEVSRLTVVVCVKD